MFDYKGKTALITGASSGIGESFARELAARGMNVVLVARSQAKLLLLAQELSQRHHVRAEAIAVDLSQEKATRIVQEAMQQFDLEVDLLVNNAATSTFAPFEQSDSLKHHQAIILNVATMVELSHAFIPGMLARGTGAILNVGSQGSFVPMPYMTVYAATKAFLLFFSEGLWAEYRDRGIQVMALCPGPTRTPSLLTSLIPLEQAARPEQVVVAGLRALEQGRISFMPEFVNNLTSRILPKVLPRSLMAQLMGRLLRSGLQIMGGMGRAFDGSYAEYTCVPQTCLFPIKSNLDWAVLGAIPEMFQTAYGSLVSGLGVQAGQTLLIRGGTSSVGMLATSLAKQMGHRQIVVNTIAPGAVATDFGGGTVRDNPEINQAIASQTALGRVGMPDYIGASLTFPSMLH